jgi:hypothetical protein
MRHYSPWEQPTDYASTGPVDPSSSALLVAGHSISLSTAPCLAGRLPRFETSCRGKPPFFKPPLVSHQVSALSGAVDNGPSSDKPARLSNASPERFPSNDKELDTGERMGSNAAAAHEGGLYRQVRCCILRISLEIPGDLGQPAKSLSEPHQ